MTKEEWEKVVGEYLGGKTATELVRENPGLFSGDRIFSKIINFRRRLKRRGVKRHSASFIAKASWKVRNKGKSVPETEDRCPCGGIILADTEDWETPLCSECWLPYTRMDVPRLIAALERIRCECSDNLFAAIADDALNPACIVPSRSKEESL